MVIHISLDVEQCKEHDTYPISPVAGVIAVRITREIVHGCRAILAMNGCLSVGICPYFPALDRLSPRHLREHGSLGRRTIVLVCIPYFIGVERLQCEQQSTLNRNRLQSHAHYKMGMHVCM